MNNLTIVISSKYSFLFSFQIVINIEHDKAKMAPVNFGDVVGPIPTSFPVPSLLAVPQPSSNVVPPPNIFPGSMVGVIVYLRQSLG